MRVWNTAFLCRGIYGNCVICRKKRGVQTSTEFFAAASGERFWALRHKVSYGLQFCRKQQNLLGYTSLAPELPRTWCTLKLEKHLKSFSCGLDPRFRLLINALWLYGVWLQSLVERAWATWHGWCWLCGVVKKQVGYMEETRLDKEAQLLNYSMIHSRFIHKSFLRLSGRLWQPGRSKERLWQDIHLTV